MTARSGSQETAFVYRIKPSGFSPAVEVAACYIEFEGKLLVLKRANEKPYGGKWGVPAGKLEKGESAHAAVIREIFEETQITLDDQLLKSVGKVYVRSHGIDFVYHMYQQKCTHLPQVNLNDEHQEFQWLSMEEIADLPLMPGAIEALHHFKALVNQIQIPRKPFYFIRHGQTDVNANPHIKRVDYDLPLNPLGRLQAQTARKLVADFPLKSVCFSPIQRAVETKEILIQSLDLEHAELEDLSECKAHIWMKMVRIEKGANFHVCDEIEGFLGRAVRGLGAALQKQSPVLLVAHGGIHWALCYHMAIENHPWKIDNCKLAYFRPVGENDWEAEVIE